MVILNNNTLLPVFTIENHNESYYVWKRLGIKNKILVHIDAHIDFAWATDKDIGCIFQPQTKKELSGLLKQRNLWNIRKESEKNLCNIGNYVYWAIKEGIVKEFYWVVPDAVWDALGERKKLKNIFLALARLNPGGAGPLNIYKDRIEAFFLGIKVTALKLFSLPAIKEDVLLDIDVDFFLINSLKGRPPYFKKILLLPWLWPEELVGQLSAKCVSCGVATIAYSVEGGFTPLEYKFLGEELKILLEGGSLTPEYPVLRKALLLCKKGGLKEAAEELKKMAVPSLNLIHRPALYYSLSCILKRLGNLKEAGLYLKEAAMVDGCYKIIYNNKALQLKEYKKYAEAIEECNFVLDVFPGETAYVLLLADILFAAGEIDEALRQYLAVLQWEPDNLTALSFAGGIYFKKKGYVLAAEFLSRALAVNDKDVFSNYLSGLLYCREGKVNEAIAYLQKSALLGASYPEIYFKLATLYAKKRNFYKAGEKLLFFLKLFFSFAKYPKGILSFASRDMLWRNLS